MAEKQLGAYPCRFCFDALNTKAQRSKHEAQRHGMRIIKGKEKKIASPTALAKARKAYGFKKSTLYRFLSIFT